MSAPGVRFDDDAALAEVASMAGRELERFAAMAASEIRRGCPGGAGSPLRKGIRVFKSEAGLVVYVPHPSRFIEFGHDVVVDGKKAGHVPPRPFVRAAILRAAARFGASYGGAVGEFAGSVVGGSLGKAGARAFGAYGRRIGVARGKQLWTRAGARLADIVEARSAKEAARGAAGLAGELAGDVTARRGG